jgi:hypothetical protein
MDGKLRKRQSEMTFQMKVLLYKNQGFLESHKQRVKEEHKKAAQQRTKEMIAMVAKDKKDSDSDIDEDMGDEEDNEMDNLMDLYEQEN